MSKRQTEHARSVVAAFKEKLSKSAVEHVGARHFEDLELLVESAVDAAVFIEVERIADRLEKVVGEVRLVAERFD